jgi:predicted ATPase/DNA-binding winged helix-turn-helix (wHTH) protein
MATPHDSTGLTLASVAAPDVVRFGPFALDISQQILLRNGARIRIGSRALALLIALVERRGELVSKETLIASVWPDTFVEEANLRVHIASLRKVLGDTNDPPQFIANVSGRGYRLVAPLGDAPAEPPPQPNGPATLTRVIGRADEVATLKERVSRRRLITISGPGGIGKTTVAFAILRGLQESFEDGIVTVDLGAAAPDADSLPQALAIALKISVGTGDAVSGLASYLKERHLLLVLDNCEHVIDAVTEITEQLLRQAQRLHILATSTEPMRAEGEWVFRLLPLAVPSEAENMTAAEAISIPAIELFAERATASSEAFRFTDADVPLVAEICRRLDGNPLAIEIAAASLEAFGLRDLAAHLDDRFQVLVQGRRTAAPRHQTLRNLLDWSHGTLSPSEQSTLRRLSVFRGAFTLEAARHVASLDSSQAAVVNDIASLVRKSLLTANFTEGLATYRLLDSTRAYARDKAAEAGESDVLNRYHADYFEQLLEQAELDWTQTGRTEWLSRYGYMIDDARAATDWAMSADGDVGQGIRLTALFLPLGFQFALVKEISDRIDAALARAEDAAPRELVAEIRLNVSHASLGQNQTAELGDDDPYIERALVLADMTGNPANRVSSLIKMAVHFLNVGKYDDGLRYADEANDSLVDSDDDLAQLGVNRVLAQTAHMAGAHQRARIVAHRVISHPARNIPLTFGSMQIDRYISMRVMMARSLWLQGFANQARSVALEALTMARNDGPYAISHTVGLGAAPIALWSGLDEEAKNLANELLDKSERFTLGMWKVWAQLFSMVLERRQGNEPVRVEPTILLMSDTLTTFDASLIDDAGMARARAGLAGWANPEMLRAAALGIARSRRSTALAEARTLLAASLEQAKAHGALAWELRTATTMAEWHRNDGDDAAARAVLEPIYERLPEGFGTADPLRARDLLEVLNAS